MLHEEFLVPLGVTETEFAERHGIPLDELRAVLSTRGELSEEMAERFATATGMSPAFWIKLQDQHSIWKTERAAT
jgi:addiction module HigA family antidote